MIPVWSSRTRIPRLVLGFICLLCVRHPQNERLSLFRPSTSKHGPSSVVSVLNSLTTIMEAPPPLLVILFLPPLSFELCLQLEGAMTLLLHYQLASSGDLPCLFGVVLGPACWLEPRSFK
ncbi:hypothetical protein C8Q74DRAFT_845887 [Fomes fomentarius]|nr:hypothetical protein C8Q74DRAFT_845887 [Fomes fomentarius]